MYSLLSYTKYKYLFAIKMFKKINFKSSKGRNIVGLLSLPESDNKLPIVIICHGFLGFKDSKMLYRPAEVLTENGYATLRFDFSGCCGASEGSCKDILVSDQIDELEQALKFIQSLDTIDSDRICLVGHSLGGTIILNEVSKNKKIKSAISIAAPASVDDQVWISDEVQKIWKEQGFYVFTTVAKRQKVRVDYPFLEEFRKYEVIKCASNIDTPTLFIQGEGDKVVPKHNAQKMFDLISSKKKEIKLIPRAGHSFLDNGLDDELASICLEWMQETL